MYSRSSSLRFALNGIWQAFESADGVPRLGKAGTHFAHCKWLMVNEIPYHLN